MLPLLSLDTLYPQLTDILLELGKKIICYSVLIKDHIILKLGKKHHSYFYKFFGGDIQQTFVDLQNVFSVIILHLPRCLQDFFEDRKFLRWRCLQDMPSGQVFKTSSRYVLRSSSRRLGDQENVYWEGI